MLSEFEVTEIITLLAGAYPHYTPKLEISNLVRMYWTGLMDLPASSIRRGAYRVIQECDYFPSVAALRRASKAEIEKMGGNHPLWTLDDHAQRFMDEMCDFAPKLLTADYIGPDQQDEFIRLQKIFMEN